MKGRSGRSPSNLNGSFADYGLQYGNSPSAINIGAFAASGNMIFSTANVYMDNWEADFVKRAFTA